MTEDSPRVEIEAEQSGDWPRLVPVHRRGPLLRAARGTAAEAGTFGLDMTAGCVVGCPFCHIRGSSRYPGEGRVLFDPGASDRLEAELEGRERLPRLVVLSPTSDPLPPMRAVREETSRAVRLLLERGIEVLVMTRGRVPGSLIEVLAQAGGRARVALGLVTLNRGLSRTLEPRAAAPKNRLRALRRLTEAGVPVEVRLEPLMAGLTDTRENVGPLFEALAAAGARRVVAHYLFLHPAMVEPLRAALQPLGLSEALGDAFEGGPTFPVGSLGPTKHLPLEVRRSGLARLAAWGAEYDLLVETGAAQNPDLPRLTPPVPQPQPSTRPAAKKADLPCALASS